jgi:chorismate mutase/prephenate dehydrogenase
MQLQPRKIAIAGGEGRFGKFFRDFFAKRGCEVKSWDADATPACIQEVVAWAEVVLIAVPLIETVKVIQSLIHLLRGHQLLMSIASTMVHCTKVMLESPCGEVLVTHPFCAPPVKRGTFKGQTLFVYRARRAPEWAVWVEAFLEATEAHIEPVELDQHDKERVIDQVLDHMCSVLKVQAMRQFGMDPTRLLKIASPAYKLSAMHMARMFVQSGALYGGLPMTNPHAMEAFEGFLHAFQHYVTVVRGNDMKAYVDGFDACRDYLGEGTIAAFFAQSEEVNQLVIDLGARNSMRVTIPADRPGLLKEVSTQFGERGINLTAFNGRVVGNDAEFFMAFSCDKNAPEVQGIRDWLERELHAKVQMG